MLENRNLRGRIRQLEAVEARSKDDIKEYVLAYYKTVAPTIAEEVSVRILEASDKHNVPFVALVAIAEVESNFNPFAISPLKSDPARGIMQVRFGQWGKKLGLTSKHQLHDIAINIDAGARIMKMLLDENKDNMKQALWKYVGVVNNKSVGNAYVKQVYENMGRFTVFRSLANQKPNEDEAFEHVRLIVSEEKPKETAKIIERADVTLFGENLNTKAQSVNPEAPKVFGTEVYAGSPDVKSLFRHKVAHRGETLGLIAKWYTGSVDSWKKILELNPGLVPEKMGVGAEIVIDRAWLTTDKKMPIEYVQKGGTLDG